MLYPPYSRQPFANYRFPPLHVIPRAFSLLADHRALPTVASIFPSVHYIFHFLSLLSLYRASLYAPQLNSTTLYLLPMSSALPQPPTAERSLVPYISLRSILYVLRLYLPFASFRLTTYTLA